MKEVLESTVVVDLTNGWAGSVATMVLGDFGAEVIKIEPPGGSPDRTTPQHYQWNRGKRSVVLDLNDPIGIREFKQLVSHADIVLEAFAPGEAARMGIDFAALSAERPDLVYCSITGFGRHGPHSGYKADQGIVAAKAGRFSAFVGQAGRAGPHYAAVQVANHGAAFAAVRGILAALFVRHRTGRGQWVETSLLQGISTFDVSDWIMWQMMLKYPEEFADNPQADPDRMPAVGYQPIRTKDGQWIQLANIVDRLFRAALRQMDLGDVLDDPRFAGAPTLLPEPREELRQLVVKRGLEKTLDEWMDIFTGESADVAAEPFMTSQQGMSHPQVIHNHHVADVHDPEVGPMHQLGLAAELRGTPGSVKGPSPLLGADTKELLDRPPSARLDAGATGRETPVPKCPLEGITVIDMSTVIATPVATSLTSELGARVIRIEALDLDLMRRFNQGVSINRTQAGVENISADLRTDEGRAILHKLVAQADVFVHNMRPGAPERLGVGYDQVKAFNPNIIFVYAGGYGDTGPHSHRPAMHPIGGAVAGGAMAQMGLGAVPPADQPMTNDEILEVSRRLGRSNETNPDPNGSMVTSTAILLGIYARERFGAGQYIQTTMLGANAYANADDFFWFDGKPDRRVLDADGYGLGPLYRLYQARESWVFLAAESDREWQDLCRALDRADLERDPRFSDSASRQEHADELVIELERVFRGRSAEEWERDLTQAGVACVEAEDAGTSRVFTRLHDAGERWYTTEVEHVRWGRFWRYKPVLDFSSTPSRVGPGPVRGQHTKSIMRELDYSDEEIAELKAQSVIDWEDVAPLVASGV